MFALSHERLRPRPTRYSLSSPFSHSYPLFCTGQKRNPFYSKYFPTLCANHPGGGYTRHPRISFRNLITRHSPPVTILFVINTYKTDTKQTTLSFFRINTCAKTRGKGTSFQPLWTGWLLTTRYSLLTESPSTIHRRSKGRAIKERLQSLQDLRKVRRKRRHRQNADRRAASRINPAVDQFPAILGRVANVDGQAFVGSANSRRHRRLNFWIAEIPAQR